MDSKSIVTSMLCVAFCGLAHSRPQTDLRASTETFGEGVPIRGTQDSKSYTVLRTLSEQFNQSAVIPIRPLQLNKGDTSVELACKEKQLDALKEFQKAELELPRFGGRVEALGFNL